nr:hypothetical protein [Corynebacterium diphtheriae]
MADARGRPEQPGRQGRLRGVVPERLAVVGHDYPRRIQRASRLSHDYFHRAPGGAPHRRRLRRGRPEDCHQQ